jgi:hypothetical protein
MVSNIGVTTTEGPRDRILNRRNIGATIIIVQASNKARKSKLSQTSEMRSNNLLRQIYLMQVLKVTVSFLLV